MSQSEPAAELISQIPKQVSLPVWRQLRWFLILSFVLLAVVPVMAAVVITLNQTEAQSRGQVTRQLESISELKTDQINRWLADSRAILNLMVANQTNRQQILTFLPTTLSKPKITRNNNLNTFLGEAVEAQNLFNEILIYNLDGRVVAASDPNQVGKIVTIKPYFVPSLANEYTQPPFYEVGGSTLTMLLTKPLKDKQNGQTIGVIAGRLDLTFLGEIMTKRTGLGETGETYLVSHESNYLITPSRYEAEGYPLARSYFSHGIEQALNGVNDSGSYSNYRNPPVSVIGVYHWLPELQVALLAEINESEALSLFSQVRNTSLGVAIGAILLAVMIGFFVASRISSPISALTQVATHIAEGDLSQRAAISERNEIGVLAIAFNSMTAQLGESIDSLEQRVTNRTQRLELMATLSEHLTAILDVEKLLQELVNQVKDRFGYYHTHVYLIDEARQNLVMIAGVGEAGAQMKAQGHHILLNAPTSLVAQAARTGQIVRVDNVRESKDWLPNPLLPDTYSEMAVPIIVEKRAVGVLDVQENEIAGLDEGDANLLRSLANQVAIAIRNARLFEQVETALANTQATHERYFGQSWETAKTVAEGGQYLYTHAQAKPLDEVKKHVLTQNQQLALTQRHPVVITPDIEGTSVVAPITLFNKAIGALQLHTSKTQLWAEEDLAVLEAVAYQFAQIAENLRLFEETRERAGREQTIREITDELRSATSLEQLAKTAAEALGERLEMEHVVVKLGLESLSPEGHSGNGHNRKH